MRVEITLRKGQDPHVYDVDTKKEISSLVQAITLTPGCQGTVTMQLLKRNEAGSPYLDRCAEHVVNPHGGPVDCACKVANEIVVADLVYLRGDWEARP